MNLDTALPLLARNPRADLDLAELAFAIARDEYAHLDIEAEMNELIGMARDVRPRLRGGLESRVTALQHFLFEELGFHGNERDYYDPRNSFLNDVLSRRSGLPISLSVVAMTIGNRAGLSVHGVGLPGHFLVKVVERDQEIILDPFHGGKILSLADCEKLVEGITGSAFLATPEALESVSPGYIIQRMLINLRGVYLRKKDYARAARTIHRLTQLLPEDRSHWRDLGTVLLQSGRPGKAIKHLESYLDSEPPPEDSRSVRELLDQARGEVARWN